MALIETAIYEKLLTTEAIADIVEDRIFPLRMPDEVEFPCITFQDVATTRPQPMSGRVNYRNMLMQIDCWAHVDRDSLFTALELARQVYLTFQGIREIASGVNIQGFLQENQQTLYEPELDLARITQIYRVQFLDE
jgi:hypothetical protein